MVSQVFSGVQESFHLFFFVSGQNILPHFDSKELPFFCISSSSESELHQFGKDEIELCLNTGFLYTLQKNLYERWSVKRPTPFSSILFAQALGKKQQLPATKKYWINDIYGTPYYSVEAPNFEKIFGESPPENAKYILFAKYLRGYISFGLGQIFAKRQREKDEKRLLSSFKKGRTISTFGSWLVTLLKTKGKLSTGTGFRKS